MTKKTKNNLKKIMKNNVRNLVIGVLGLFAVVSFAGAYSGTAQNVFENATVYMQGNGGDDFQAGGLLEVGNPIFVDGLRAGRNELQVIDASGNIDAPITSTNGTFSGTLAVTGATTLTGAAALSSTLGVTGVTTLTGGALVPDDINVTFGTGSDWTVNYDESVDNQLLFQTAAVGAVATTDPMFEILASTTPTADQQIFGVAKGTQSSNTALFTVDEDGDALIAGTLGVTGASAIDTILYEELTEAVTAANTITSAESGTTFYVSGAAATSTLPAVATAAGEVYRFVVNTALSGDHVIASAEGDNIEGVLSVAGAVVDCDAEDFITFVSDGENLGDYVTLRSDGTSWFIGANDALSATKLTCTDPA